MADTLNIKISVEQVGQSSGLGTTSVNSEEAKENAKIAVKVNKAMSIAQQLGMQITNSYVSTIGIRTGNYAMKERIQRSINIGSKVVSTTLAFIANPVLGLVALAGEGINYATEVYSYQEEIKWQNREAAELRRRAGYLNNSNRSR